MTKNLFALAFAAVLFSACSLMPHKKPASATAAPQPGDEATAAAPATPAGLPGVPGAEEGGTDEAATLIGLADGKMEQEDLEAAKASYLKAYDLLPDADERRVQVSERLGNIMSRDNKVRVAKRLFMQAISLAKKNNNGGKYLADAHNGLAACLEKEGRTDMAVRNYQKAAQLTTDKAAQARIRAHIRELKTKKPAAKPAP